MTQLTTRITAFLDEQGVAYRVLPHCEWVNISSGDPMAGLELRPQDLIRLAKAVLAPIAKEPDSGVVR